MTDYDCEKLKNGQGHKDNNGNIWKKDQLHKDHWDITDRHGNKIRDVDFIGNEIWYHNMNEATQGSNPDANRQYMKKKAIY